MRRGSRGDGAGRARLSSAGRPPASGRSPSRAVRTAGVVAIIALAAVAGVLVSPLIRSAKPRPAASQPRAQPAAAANVTGLAPPAKGFAVPRPRGLADSRGVTRWAPVIRPTQAHVRPDLASPVVAAVGTSTPEGTANLVDSNGEATRGSVTWVRARLATLPAGRIGWLPRRALGGWSFVDTQVTIDRRALKLTLFRDGKPVFSTPVGVGKPGTPTPAGHFYIRDRLTRYASPEYGPVAFGTSARSAQETDWPAGGFIGIHGTDEPELVPGRISHGCIRLRNAAILTLAKLMPVGTPVTVR